MACLFYLQQNQLVKLRGHPVHELNSLWQVLAPVEIDLFTVFRKIFQSFLKIKFESPHGLGHIFDFVSCIPDVAYVPMSNFSCHCLIDRLLTNQIALLLPIRGRTEFGKMFGIKGRRFLPSPPPPTSCSPPPYFSPIFWFTPGVLLCSPAFRSLVRSPRGLKKERNRLLRRLPKYL